MRRFFGPYINPNRTPIGGPIHWNWPLIAYLTLVGWLVMRVVHH